MSVVGFDLGNQNAFIAVARAGGIDVLINDYSLHATPTCVSFGQRNRSMGVAARQQISTNIKNTVLYFKHLLGRKFDDPVAQKFLANVTVPVVKGPGGEIYFEVDYLGVKNHLTVEQITAAFLVKLKIITEAQLGSRVTDVVISVPANFTDVQRQSLLAAGHIAGLNVLKIVNEDIAVGIAYGIYKKGLLPAQTEKPRLVAFVDVGHSAVTASLMEFQERQVKVRETVTDLEVGGYYFDRVICEHFTQEFLEKYKVDARSSPRAWLRLMDECEKLKKQMSANTTVIPLGIECFLNDVDVSGKMCRADFEQLAEPLFERIRQLLHTLLMTSGVNVADIHEVEVIGGSSRIPFVKQIIAHIFNREPKTTMNADDVVARGAAMQCAILSPTIKVMEFNVIDGQNYPIAVEYVNSEGKTTTQQVFKHNDEFPHTRVLPLHKSEPFQISAFYEQPSNAPHTQQHIGTWQVNEVTKPHDADYRVVRVKLGLDQNGVFGVTKAMYEEKFVEEVEEEVPVEEPMDTSAEPTSQAEEPKDPKNPKTSPAKNGDAEAPPAEPAKPKTEKRLVKRTKKNVVDLPVVKVSGFNMDVQSFVEFEKQMQGADLQEKLKADSRNALEEYVYSMRDKLCEQFAEFVTEEESDKFRSLLTQVEDWLYGDGEDASKDECDKKLNALREAIEPPINKRQREKADKEEIAKNLAAEEAAKANGAPSEPIVEEPMDQTK